MASWMEATCEDPEHEMKALVESGRIAISSGCPQTGRVARTRSNLASMSGTVLSLRLGTTTVNPSGETRAIPGEVPTRTVRDNRASFEIDDADIRRARIRDIRALAVDGDVDEIRAPCTPIVATTVLVSALITVTLFDPGLTT